MNNSTGGTGGDTWFRLPSLVRFCDRLVPSAFVVGRGWLLASETDATKREPIARLLAEEEAKLAKISKE